MKLVIQDNADRLVKDKDYLMIPRLAWEFLICIYGGGPTLIKNEGTE